MCTLEKPQKLQHKFLLLTFCYLLYFRASLSNCELILYFCFCSFFHSYGSFNHANITSMSFSEFSELFTLHFHLSGVTSDIVMSVLHKSSIFFASLCILDVLYVSFHHASSMFLRVPHCSSLGLLLIGLEASHLDSQFQ